MATTTKTTKKAASKQQAKGMSASAARAEGAARTKRALKEAKAEAPEAAASAATTGEPAAEAPVAATEAQDAARANDGAVAAKPAAKRRGKAPKVEVLGEDEAKKRGMIEIVKTLKTRDPAVRQATAKGPPHFVIAHEDGRFSVARPSEPPADAGEAADAENARASGERAASADGMTASERAMTNSANAKKHSFVTAPGKALDHILAEGKRRQKAKAKAAAKPAAAKGKGGAKPKAAKPAKDRKPKRMSALDAAAQVLAKAKQPMRARDLIEAMAKQGLWESPKGATPHATLYAAMLREISKKGKDARFKKVDRGAFVATPTSGKGA